MFDINLYNECIEVNSVLKKEKTKKFGNKIYTLGYIDAIYDEHEYIRYIPDDLDCIDIYTNGYREGKIDKRNNKVKTIFDKEVFLDKMVVKDFKNNYRDRKLSDEAQTIYDNNYEDLIKYGEIEYLGDYDFKTNIKF